jgi:hypothetical protein
VLYAHCADVGRDPKEITLSSHVNLADGNVGAVAERVAELAPEGLDLAIVYLREPLNPAILTPLAEALAALA